MVATRGRGWGQLRRRTKSKEKEMENRPRNGLPLKQVASARVVARRRPADVARRDLTAPHCVGVQQTSVLIGMCS